MKTILAIAIILNLNACGSNPFASEEPKQEYACHGFSYCPVVEKTDSTVTMDCFGMLYLETIEDAYNPRYCPTESP